MIPLPEESEDGDEFWGSGAPIGGLGGPVVEPVSYQLVRCLSHRNEAVPVTGRTRPFPDPIFFGPDGPDLERIPRLPPECGDKGTFGVARRLAG